MDSGVSLAQRRLGERPTDGAAALPLRVDAESLQRELRSAHNEAARVRMLYDEKDQQCRRLQAALVDVRKTVEKLESQAGRHVHERDSALQERDKSVRQAEEAKAYVRKLEAKLLAGKGEFLVEQNTKLRDAVQTLRSDNDQLQTTNSALRSELDNATKEIEVLATALEMRADELALDGNLRSGLLFEVAHRREEVKQLQQQLAEAGQARESHEFELKEMRIQLQKANADVTTMSDRVAKLSTEVQAGQSARTALEQKLRSLEHERDVSLDFVADQSSKLAEALLRAEVASKKATDAHREAGEAEANKATTELQLAKYKGSCESLQAALTREQDARSHAEGRALTSESEASALRGELSSVRAQLASITAAHDKSQLELGARSQEVSSLQDRLRAVEHESAASTAKASAQDSSSKAAHAAVQERHDALARQQAVLTKERDEARAAAAEVQSKLTVSQLECARLQELVSDAQANISTIKHKWTEAQASLYAQVSALRERLAEEQAARHADRVQWMAEKAERVELAAHQRAGDTARSAPKQRSPHTDKHDRAGSPSRASSSVAGSLARPGPPLTQSIIPPSAQAAASLVRDALAQAGLDPTLADEWLTTKVGKTEVTLPVPFSLHVRERSPARNYRDVKTGPTSWHLQLRNGPAPASPGRSGSANRRAAAPVASPPRVPSATGAANGSSMSAAVSPGTAALNAAIAKARAGRAATQAGAAGAQAGPTGQTVSYAGFASSVAAATGVSAAPGWPSSSASVIAAVPGPAPAPVPVMDAALRDAAYDDVYVFKS